jgi:hypothetical protein
MRSTTEQLVLAPDAALVITHYLRDRLVASAHPAAAGVAVSGSLPPGRSVTRHVRVRRTGGTMANRVEDAPRVDVQVWHLDDRQRNALANLCRALIWQATGTVVNGAGMDGPCTIGRVAEFAGPNELPDPRSTAAPESAIIQFTAEMRLRGAAAA